MNCNLLWKENQDLTFKKTPEYTTEEERARGEDVKNSTKLDVLQRAEDKIQVVFDEDVLTVLQITLDDFKRKLSS